MSRQRGAHAVVFVMTCACCVALFSARSQAEPSALLGRPNPLADLLPTPAARAAAEGTRLARELERALAALPGVTKAQVVLNRPLAAAEPLDRALPATRASVVLRTRGAAGPNEDQVRGLVSGVLGPDSEIRLEFVLERSPMPEPSPPSLTRDVRVGPFRVAAQSAGWLRGTLAGCLLANGALAALLLRQRWRR